MLQGHLSSRLAAASSALWIVLSLSTSQAATPDSILQIRLRPFVNVPPRVIRIDDVAELNGGPANLRSRIAALDVEDALSPEQCVKISAKVLSFRLQLAGIASSLFRIDGTTSQVTCSPLSKVPTLSDGKTTGQQVVFQSARELVLRHLPWQREDVEIRLVRQLSSLPSNLQTSGRLEPKLRSAWPPVGNVRVAVQVNEGGRTTEIPVDLEVKHFIPVVMTKVAVQRGQPFTRENLYLQRQDVSRLRDYVSSIDELIGRQAAADLRPLQLIRRSSVLPASQERKPIVIRRRDQVKLVALIGSVKIAAKAEALQDGRVGELIRFRNTKSNKVILGRVVNRQEARAMF